MPSYSCYLAGPISGCNDLQKNRWRARAKGLFGGRGWECVDPVTALNPWTPLKESELIDKVDAVVANLWRESIGTIIGIMQSASLSKPVILVTETFIESQMLFQIVGRQNVVSSLDEAADILDRIRDRTVRTVTVRKRDGRVESFDPKKIKRKLSDACAKVGLADVWLPSMVAMCVQDALLSGGVSEVSVDEVRHGVATELHRLTNLEDVYKDDVEVKVSLLLTEWNEISLRKTNQKELDQVAASIADDASETREINKKLRYDNAILREMLHGRGDEPTDLTEDQLPLYSLVKERIGERGCVCVRSKQDSHFIPVLCALLGVNAEELKLYCED